jgi:hypothetical protein
MLTEKIILLNFNVTSLEYFSVVLSDWGLGIGDWGLGPIPNPQSPFCLALTQLLESQIF